MGQLPEHVDVGPIRYPIVRDDAAANEVAVEMQTDVVAACQKRIQRIVLRPGCGPDVEAVSLLHECLHAVFTNIGRGWIDDEKEEELTDALAAPLLDLLRRNPDLVAYLVA